MDIFNTVFTFIGLYFIFLFLLLFISYKKKLFYIPPAKRLPSVSIIIPAYNEEKNIKKTIKAVKRLAYPKKKEIIVINDGSTDKTYEIIKKIKGIKVLNRKKNKGRASALNLGLKHAKGEIVVRIDSDSYPEKNALLKTIPFFEEGVAAVTTCVFVKKAKSIVQRLQRVEYITIAWTRKLLENLNAIYATPGAMSLYKRKILKKVGGFDEKNLTEDIEITWRLLKNKYKVKMSLNTKVYTNVPENWNKWWKQRLRWNIGGLQTNLKYFHLFLNKEFSNIGMFLIPLFSIGFVLSLLSLFFMSYILINWLYFAIGSYTFGFNPINSFYILPDVFFFIIIFTFILTITTLKINLREMKKSINTPKESLDLLIYIFLYILIFPFNLLHSSFNFLIKKYE